jgi:hypothetical protein
MKIADDLSIPINVVIMKDELQHETKFGNYIINLQHGNGTHWTNLIERLITSFYFAVTLIPPTVVPEIITAMQYIRDEFH